MTEMVTSPHVTGIDPKMTSF